MDASESTTRQATVSTGYRPWLHRFAMFFVAATFVLLISGGNVTSREAGLAVPDGWTVFGHNLFTFPFEKWVGNVLHEHSHRLMGSLVGMLAIAIMIWIMRTQPSRYWLRALAVGTLSLIVFQGIMGGLRVEQISTTWAILHGIHAQIILAVTVLLAAATSRYWMQRSGAAPALPAAEGRRSRMACHILLVVLLIQLSLGAAMRHNMAGLAIPDFPTSYGGLVPPMEQQAITESFNQIVPDYDLHPVQPYTPAQVGLHFAHRVWAVGVVIAVLAMVTILARGFSGESLIRRPLIVLVALMVVQIALGVSVIWMRKPPDVATAHQATGAVILALTALLTYRVHLLTQQPAKVADGRGSPRIAATLEGSPA